ncbi:MAG: hypothetical protein FWB75_00645 [Oscillospiraceae bacterium]|nr:hypothetical protein [Oscillospiraceae bacterium]
MIKKLYGFPSVAYIYICSFIRELKEDERGLSGVVVAVLLILVAVLAIVLIWVFLGEWLEELWDQITGEAERII